MAWPCTAPAFLVAAAAAALVAVPQTPVLALVAHDALTLLDSRNLLQLASLKRLQTCLDAHGHATSAQVRLVALNLAQLGQAHAANVFVATQKDHVLVYYIAINYSQGQYDIVDMNSNHLLQDLLPRSAAAKSAFSFFSSSKSLAHHNLENVECSDPDADLPVPTVKLLLVKIIETSGFVGFWCVPTSQKVVFCNKADELQVLNIKTFDSLSTSLADYPWFSDVAALEYSPYNDYFLHVDTTGALSLWLLDGKLALHPLASNTTYSKFVFGPRGGLVACRHSEGWEVCQVARGTAPSFCVIAKLPEAETVKWAPNGQFVALLHEGGYTLATKLGCVLFLAKGSYSQLEFSHNSQRLFLLDQRLHILDLVLLNRRGPVLLDSRYITTIEPELHKFPLPTRFQDILGRLVHINGGVERKPSGVWTMDRNKYNQLSLLYGNHLAVSTPILCGGEPRQALWFNFTNHYVEPMNIVDHFWVDDFLLLVNRYEDDDPDFQVDELVIANAAQTKYGAGGTDFKFDTDCFAYRHAFKHRIVVHELIDDRTLIIITGDFKIVMMDVLTEGKKNGGKKLSIRVRRTIHLSSIKHKLPVALILQMAVSLKRHFFFLLENGDLLLLINQLPDDCDGTQMNNMYELVKVSAGVEHFSMCSLFGEQHLCLFTGHTIKVHHVARLIETAEEAPQAPISLNLQFLPLSIKQTSRLIEVTGYHCDFYTKKEHELAHHNVPRQMVLTQFLSHSLFTERMPLSEIIVKYAQFDNFSYSLELLLFDYLNKDELERIVELVDATPLSEAIYVNFLRKIEIQHWHKFFTLISETPTTFMRRLIQSEDVQLCYTFLIVYLNFKREFDAYLTPDESAILDDTDRSTILTVIGLLARAECWDECFELCRFIKLLEPGPLLGQVKDFMISARPANQPQTLQ